MIRHIYDFRRLQDSSAVAKEFSALTRADHLCIAIDGEKISALEGRQVARNDSRSILRSVRFRRTGWWGQYGSNCQLPTQSSNRSQERNFSMQRQRGETGKFAAISPAGNRTSWRHNCAGLRPKICPRIHLDRFGVISAARARSPLVSRSYRRIRMISTH
jgi:hypothetical protein